MSDETRKWFVPVLEITYRDYGKMKKTHCIDKGNPGCK